MKLMRFSIILVGYIVSLSAWAAVSAPSRDNCLSDLRQIKAQNQTRLREVESKMKILLSGAPGANVGFAASPTLPNIEREIEDLSAQHSDLALRQQFLDRLMFEIDSHFKGGDLRQFLQVKLVAMAQTDLVEASSDRKMWKFLTYLAKTLQDMPDRDSSPMSVVEGYLKFSSITAPAAPEVFLKAQNYSNGKDSVAATPVARDEIGVLVESKINQVSP